ncbi:MAG: hypothetical protein GF400_00950 [Candidatus Eisenbacteria bacterium]|nr:hypothetical protein [Candidatus Eisenbacteria bacterium]
MTSKTEAGNGQRRSPEIFRGASVPHLSRRAAWLAVGVFLVALVALAGTANDALLCGDSAVYAAQIERGDFTQRTIHIAYYMMGYAFTRLLPIPINMSLNLMSAFLGAMSAALISLMAYTTSGRHDLSLVAGGLLLTNHVFVLNAVSAEVYVPGTFLLLLAALLWLHRRSPFAGAALGASFLVSPSAALTFPFFAVTRPRWRALLTLAGVASLVVAVAVVPNLRDYLFGARGLLNAAGDPVSYRTAVLKEGWEIVVGFFVCLPFVLSGLLRVLREKALRGLGVGLLATWAVTLVFGERYVDVPVQLPTYALMCLVGALGFEAFARPHRVARRAGHIWFPAATSVVIAVVAALATRAAGPRTDSLLFESPTVPMLTGVAASGLLYALAGTAIRRLPGSRPVARRAIAWSTLALLLGATGAFAYARTAHICGRLADYESSVLRLDRLARPGHIVVGRWGKGILFDRYAIGGLSEERWINTEHMAGSWGEALQEAAEARWAEALASGREIWLLESYPALERDLEEAGYVLELFGEVYRATRPPEEAS